MTRLEAAQARAVISCPAGGRVVLFIKTPELNLECSPNLLCNKCREIFPQWLVREDDDCTALLTEVNLLKPNDRYIYIYIYIYICRTAALTSRRYILNIYSTNIHTEYFKHAA